MNVWHFLLVAAGGSLGAVSRFYTSQFIGQRFPSAIPYGTLTVNVLGSFLLGLLVGSTAFGHTWQLLAGTGFLGAFTTFSTIQLESVHLLRDRKAKAFITYTLSTYALGIIAALIGYLAAS